MGYGCSWVLVVLDLFLVARVDICLFCYFRILVLNVLFCGFVDGSVGFDIRLDLLCFCGLGICLV